MKQWRPRFPVEVMSRLFGISPSGFYAWLSRPPSIYAQEDERLNFAIKPAHQRTRNTRLQSELAAEGFIVGRDRIDRLRREMGIRCKQKRKFKATTNSNHSFSVADNLLGQEFNPTAPNQFWVTDITYIPTQDGWLYLAGVKDVFTCEIVGYAMNKRMHEPKIDRAGLIQSSTAETTTRRTHSSFGSR